MPLSYVYLLKPPTDELWEEQDQTSKREREKEGDREVESDSKCGNGYAMNVANTHRRCYLVNQRQR